jgi:predicted Zn-dependent peptidase
MTADDPRTVPAADCRIQVRRGTTIDGYATAGAGRRIAGARLFWLGGPLAEDATRAGVHAVTMQAVLRSPPPGLREPLAQRLESMGVAVTAGVTATSCYIDLRGPREQLGEALHCTAHALASPGIDAPAFQAARAATIHEVEQRGHDRKTIAADALRAAWAGADNPLARPPEGTSVSLRALRLPDVQAAAQSMLRQRLGLVVAGDPALDTYLEQVAELAGLVDPVSGEPEPPTRLTPPLGAAIPPLLQVGTHGPTYLLWGTVTPTKGAADHVVAETATHILGGWSGSLWQSLFREELGYTYGTSASTTSLRLGSQTYTTMQVGMSVPAEVAERVRDLLRQQADAVAAGGLDLRLHRGACLRLLRSEAHFHDATRNLMARTASFLQAGLGAQFAAARMAALRESSPEWFAQRLCDLVRSTTVLTVSGSTGQSSTGAT